MRPFNCLSSDCPIFGPHLLEASAGTGKTFSIEHVVVRLLIESEEIEIEQILAVTFTRAATRDLKRRIRANIEEALSRIQSGKKGWEYLDPYLGSEQAARKLRDASLAFDRCQIYTIHGFCYRMLQEFAFEAELGFSLRDPDREAAVPKRLRQEAKKFIETGIGPDLLCPEQMACLLKECDSLDELVQSLLAKKSDRAALPFAGLLERYTTLLPKSRSEESKLLEAFRQIQPNFKTQVKGDFEMQVQALARSWDDPARSFRRLLKEKGSLFDFLAPSNMRAKAKAGPNSHAMAERGMDGPEFFNWASLFIGPLIREATNKKMILGCLQEAWKRIEEPILAEEGWFGPDEILKRMKSAVDRESFSSCVRKKYQAVIVDEFQDTDPLQWEIFKILFLNERTPLAAFYLVGDPKQSIYRFRKADIYTYFEARNLLGSSALFCLDTNYRSSAKMIGALNALFSRNWLTLPKLKETIPCPAVKSHSGISSDFADEKGAVHFIVGPSFEACWLPYAVLEIERLMPLLKSPSSFAVLVKDRYQAEIALRLFQQQLIPAVARSHIPLGKTLGFQAVRELFEALAFPRDGSLRRIVQAGPFASLSIFDGCSVLEAQGFIPFCRQILSSGLSNGLEFQLDLKQVIEELLAWEGRSGFSFEGVLRFLDEFERLDPEEGGKRRVETDTEAVQILTLHVSKGLEFDVVFALGLAARPPETEDAEEAEAEKLRQLYVAMTRAKRRLYVPLPAEEKLGGCLSPMELFCKTLEAQEGSVLPFLGKIEEITCETLSERISLLPPVLGRKQEAVTPISPSPPIISPCFLHSFTSLAHPKSKEWIKRGELSQAMDSHNIPRGVETGILIHQIFEQLFSASMPIWKDLHSVEALVAEQLNGTSLNPWETAIKEMVWKTLNLPLSLHTPFSLIELMPGQFQVEMEFLFSQQPHFVKGYIDLVFLHAGKFYFLDWKANWLGSDDTAYLSLSEAMAEHDYWLQAKLYAEALRRHVKQFYTQSFEEIFGGAIYLFLRGGRFCCFKPELLKEVNW
jgi:exodeoxyribonuclease V beta subunit